MGLFRKSAIGLDISDRSIEAILIRKKAGVSELVSYGRLEVPAGIVVNGYVERRNDLIQMIRKLLADGMNPPLSKNIKRVILSIPESRVFGHVFEVPRIADTTELRKTLSFEADAFFPYGHEDMVGSMVVTSKRPDTKDIHYSAVHKETLKSYLNMFHQAGLDLVVVEPESAAIARALLQPDERSPVVIVDIGARVTDLTIVDRNGPQFSETLNIAGDVFTSILSERLNIPFDEAEDLKKEHGIAGKLAQEIEDAIKAELGKLAKDILQAITFFEKRSGRIIEKVVLAGGSSLMPGLMEHLEGRLVTEEKDIDVALGDSWFDLKMKQSDTQDSLSNRGILMATAIGLALRGAGVKKFPEINFLDNADEILGQLAESSKKKRARGISGYPPWLIALIGFFLFISTAFGTWYVTFHFYIQRMMPSSTVVVEEVLTADAIELNVSAVLGDVSSAEDGLLRGVPIEVEKSVTRTFAHAGTETDGRAAGEVTVINGSSSGQTLVATTRLLSEKGILFRLAERVFVPAYGQASVRVEADQEGASGDIDPSQFTIPGLPPATQKIIYAESSERMTGGVRFTGASLTQAEYESAVVELGTEAGSGLFEAAILKAGEEFILNRDLLSVEDAEVISGPIVGEATGDYELTVRVRGVALAVSAEDVDMLLREDLLVSSPDIAQGARFGRIDIEVVEYQKDSREADLIIHAIALPE